MATIEPLQQKADELAAELLALNVRRVLILSTLKGFLLADFSADGETPRAVETSQIAEALASEGQECVSSDRAVLIASKRWRKNFESLINRKEEKHV